MQITSKVPTQMQLTPKASFSNENHTKVFILKYKSHIKHPTQIQITPKTSYSNPNTTKASHSNPNYT